jgi:hypothetical protein
MEESEQRLVAGLARNGADYRGMPRNAAVPFGAVWHG